MDVAVVMGSASDYDVMQHSEVILCELGVEHGVYVVSAHRTPDRLYDFAKGAESKGFKVIIAGASGAAHLPGMIASMSALPILGVPVNSPMLGLDSLLSIAQMPGGVPVATFAVGKPGAINAAIFAAKILALTNEPLKAKLEAWSKRQSDSVPLGIMPK